MPVGARPAAALCLALIRSFCRQAGGGRGGVMPRVYVRCVAGEPRMQINFAYSHQPGCPARQYNMDRLQDEPISRTLERVSQNISTALAKKRKAKSAAAEAAPVSVTLRLESADVPLETANKLAWRQGSTFVIDGYSFAVEVNAPKVLEMELPSCIMQGVTTYPSLETEFCSTDECDFTWYREDGSGGGGRLTDGEDGVELVDGEDGVAPVVDGGSRSRGGHLLAPTFTVVGTGLSYTPTPQDFGRRLKLCCVPRSGARAGDPVEVVSKYPVAVGPGECPFHKRQALTANRCDPESFRAVSYNILADTYADTDFARQSLFPYCPPAALSIDYRKLLLVNELQGYNSDIICLQEVDKKVYEHYFNRVFSAIGFDSYMCEKYHRKVIEESKSKSKVQENGSVVGLSEGSAIFFRSDRFRLIGKHDIQIAETLETNPIYRDLLNAAKQSPKVHDSMLYRSGACMQACVLERIHEESAVHEANGSCDFVAVPRKQRLCVANVHLYFHPDAGVVRLLQGAVCLRHLEQLRNMYETPDISLSVMLCGDFNSTPTTALYQYITEGTMSADDDVWQSFPDSPINGLELSHGLRLMNASGTPAYTNYTPSFNGCLDYIFTDGVGFRTDESIPLPSHDEVVRLEGLPNALFPSDHLAVICNFSWHSSAENNAVNAAREQLGSVQLQATT